MKYIETVQQALFPGWRKQVWLLVGIVAFDGGCQHMFTGPFGTEITQRPDQELKLRPLEVNLSPKADQGLKVDLHLSESTCQLLGEAAMPSGQKITELLERIETELRKLTEQTDPKTLHSSMTEIRDAIQQTREVSSAEIVEGIRSVLDINSPPLLSVMSQAYLWVLIVIGFAAALWLLPPGNLARLVSKVNLDGTVSRLSCREFKFWRRWGGVGTLMVLVVILATALGYIMARYEAVYLAHDDLKQNGECQLSTSGTEGAHAWYNLWRWMLSERHYSVRVWQGSRAGPPLPRSTPTPPMPGRWSVATLPYCESVYMQAFCWLFVPASAVIAMVAELLYIVRCIAHTSESSRASRRRRTKLIINET